MILDPVIPPSWITALAVLATVLTVWSHLKAGTRVGRFRNGLLTVVRLVAILAIISLLLQPSREEKITPPTVEKSLVFAIDSSASMAENDTEGVRRVDQAVRALDEAGVLSDPAAPFRFYLFDKDARIITPDGIAATAAAGPETRIHSSLRRIFRSQSGAPPAGLVLLSDGHDFEAVPPGHTAQLAQSRQCPIYAIPFGAGGNARDVSIRVTNFHPYTFRRQQTRLAVTIRTVGCPHEILTVELRRENRTVRTKRVETGDQSFHEVEFMVAEEDAGQFEYTFRVNTLPHELEAGNNTAVSYLNVLDEKVRILVIEGEPYWDTTFLRRSLARNDKLDVDALVRFTGNRTRAIRSNPKRKDEPLATPKTAADFTGYKAVVLGRNVETILGDDGIRELEKYVDEFGGIVLFSRGKAWSSDLASPLEPVRWTDHTTDAALEITGGGLALAPFKLLHAHSAKSALPEVVAYQPAGDLKTLAAPYGQTASEDVAIVYRRLGSGQTLSLGVANLWRWVFNANTEFDNNVYDLFWDQLVLWLLANGGVSPSSDYAFQTNTANLPVGEEITFSLVLNAKAPPNDNPVVTLYQGQDEAATLTLNPDPKGDSYSAAFTPRGTGRYRAETKLPNGKPATARFMVFREQLERTETAADIAYLKQLSRASGGSLIEPDGIKDLVSTLLRESSPMEPRTRLHALWDAPKILLLITFLLAFEWYLRRRWGLS
jgi:hypothetical protein